MSEQKAIHLALQGGGSHGAFTWGVLERILQDERIAIEAFSGTSAGAMNAVVAADGLLRGGRGEAIRSLDRLWTSFAAANDAMSLMRQPMQPVFGFLGIQPPADVFRDFFARWMSPYGTNPLGINPLRSMIAASVDFDRLRATRDIKLFVTATNVRTGRPRIFGNEELTADAVMASACLPSVFQAVEIDGESYWDGGYVGNPLIMPVVQHLDTDDHVIVQIFPIDRPDVPRTSRDIEDRTNEITFNASIVREIDTLNMIQESARAAGCLDHPFARTRLHRIDADDVIRGLAADTKILADSSVLQRLRQVGRDTAEHWIERHYDDLGMRASLELRLAA